MTAAFRDRHGELWIPGQPAGEAQEGAAGPYDEAKRCGARCNDCALKDAHKGPVPAQIRPGAKTLFVVEQPSDDDILPGRLFESGRGFPSAAERWNEALEKADTRAEEFSLIPVQLCHWDQKARTAWAAQEKLHQGRVKAARLAKEKAPDPTHGLKPIDACRPRLMRDAAVAVGVPDEEASALARARDTKALAAAILRETTKAATESKPFVAQPMGYGALTPTAQVFGVPHGTAVAQAGEVKVTSLDKQFLTAIVSENRPVIVPNHSIQYTLVQGNRQLAPYTERGIQRALTIARRGYVDWTPPVFNTLPTIDRIEEVLRGFIARWRETRESGRPAWVACDIETTGLEKSAKILCIGFAQRQADGRIVSISVPIRKRLSGYVPEKGKPIDHSKYAAPWPWTSEEKTRLLAIIREVFAEAGVTGHNFVQFDRGQLGRAGWLGTQREVWEWVFGDTMVQDRNTPNCELPHSLVTACATRFEVYAWKDTANDKATTTGGGDESMAVYNQIDCRNQLELQEIQDREFYEHSTVDQSHTDAKAAAVYANMGEIGLPVSHKKYTQFKEKLEKSSAQWLAKIREFLAETRRPEDGKAPMSADAAKTWTPTPANVRDFLFDHCKITPVIATGAKKLPWEPGLTPAVDAISFTRILEERNVKGTPAQTFIQYINEFRAVDKLLSTYLTGLTKIRNEPGCWGRALVEWENVPGFADPLWMLHPTYRLSIPTGRVSTSPTIQNWPERTRAGISLRALIVAPPGHVFVGADLEQVELRIYAIMSGDQELLRVFADPTIDAHAWNYATISVPNPEDRDQVRRMHDYVVGLKNSTSKDKQQEAKKLRNIAKRFVYLITYGGEPDKLFATMVSDRDKITFELSFPGITEDQTKRWYDAWHRIHPETKRWQNKCVQEAKELGSVAGIGDFRRRFFFGGLNKRNAAANATIQGSAAFIANRGVINLSEIIRFRSWSAMTGLVLQIHDYIGAFVPVQYAEYALQAIMREMPWSYKGMDFGIEAKVSNSWAYQ